MDQIDKDCSLFCWLWPLHSLLKRVLHRWKLLRRHEPQNTMVNTLWRTTTTAEGEAKKDCFRFDMFYIFNVILFLLAPVITAQILAIGGFIVDGVMWIYVFCLQMVNLMTSPSYSYGILFYYIHEANSGWRSAELASARDGEIHFLQYIPITRSQAKTYRSESTRVSRWWSSVQKDNKDQFPSSSLDLSFCFWQGGLTPGYPIYYRVIVIAKSFDFSLTFVGGRSSAPAHPFPHKSPIYGNNIIIISPMQTAKWEAKQNGSQDNMIMTALASFLETIAGFREISIR